MSEALKSLQAEYADYPDVRLVAVCKTATPEQIIEAYQCGVRDFGENRVQNLEARLEQLPAGVLADIRWHLLGHIQSNKLNKLMSLPIHLIHSIDSLEIAQKISDKAMSSGKRQGILLQVNISGESQKTGFSPEQLKEDIPELAQTTGLDIQGLMTMAPLTNDLAEIDACFARLHELRDTLALTSGMPLQELSMGMSHDFMLALKRGATIIRIGNRIFGSIT